jgi:hypothetical protein
VSKKIQLIVAMLCANTLLSALSWDMVSHALALASLP